MLHTFLNTVSKVKGTLCIGRDMDEWDDERRTEDAKSVGSKGIL